MPLHLLAFNGHAALMRTHCQQFCNGTYIGFSSPAVNMLARYLLASGVIWPLAECHLHWFLIALVNLTLHW
jgi:hypothetical protein